MKKKFKLSRNAKKRQNADLERQKTKKSKKAELSTTQKLRQEMITKQYANRGLYQEYSRAYMESYVNRNINTAIGKLKRAEKRGYYMSSDLMKEARSKLRQLYRKMGLDENMYHKSESFRGSLSSNADYAVLFRAIHNVMDVDVRLLAKEHRAMEARLKEIGINMASDFRKLSILGSEFREVYAFMSYQEVSHIIEAGGDYMNVFQEFVKRAESKVLDPEEYNKRLSDINKLYNKMQTNLNSDEWRTMNHMIKEMRKMKYNIGGFGKWRS